MDERPGFWQRQFTGPATDWQKYFDVLMGIVVPTVCLIADPGVFTNDATFLFENLPLLRNFAYVFVAIEMLTLGLWLFVPCRAPIPAAIFSGCFLAGGVLSFALGVTMFPMTLVGMIVLIGFLGLTPFFTAFVFLRNATRALRLAGTSLLVPVLAIVGALLPLLPAYAALHAGTRAIARLIADPQSDAALSQARLLGVWRRRDLALAYENEANPRRKANLAKAYQRLTGEDVEVWLSRRWD
jgi:hypothetical protein